MNTKKNIYDVVTERVIEGLQKKGLKYFQPWTNEGGNIERPINRSSGTYYNGINVFLLNWEMDNHQYETNEWVTYKQATALGGSVKKGSTATGVTFWAVSYCKDEKWYTETQLRKAGIPKSACHESWSLRVYYVFNISQCEGVESNYPPTPVTEGVKQPFSTPSDMLTGYVDGPALTHGGDRAFYRPSTDSITMPNAHQFISGDAYYAVLFHEAIHSTGHESRLNRIKDVAAFGSEDYAQEELVAEIGSQMLLAIHGIDIDLDHSQAYINGWVSKLKEQPKMVCFASTQATKAVDRIIGA